MLISRNHGFYFLKPKKSAGTTVECVLGQLCQGENDVYTKFRVSEEVDKNYRQGSTPNEFSTEFVEHTNYDDLSSRVDLSGLTPIAVIRHPYAICASACAWHERGYNQYNAQGFVSQKSDDYVRWWYNKRFGPNCDAVYSEERKYEMYRQYEFYGDALKHPDLITLRFSHIEEDLNNLCDQYDIPAEIPHTKKTNQYTPEMCKEILYDYQLEHIQEYFKKSFDYWGWEK